MFLATSEIDDVEKSWLQDVAPWGRAQNAFGSRLGAVALDRLDQTHCHMWQYTARKFTYWIASGKPIYSMRVGAKLIVWYFRSFLPRCFNSNDCRTPHKSLHILLINIAMISLFDCAHCWSNLLCSLGFPCFCLWCNSKLCALVADIHFWWCRTVTRSPQLLRWRERPKQPVPWLPDYQQDTEKQTLYKYGETYNPIANL